MVNGIHSFKNGNPFLKMEENENWKPVFENWKWEWDPGYRGLEPSGRHFPVLVTAYHCVPFHPILFYFIVFYFIFIPVRAPSGRPASHPQPAGQPVIFHFCCPAGLIYTRKPLIYTYILRKSRFLCLETRRRQPGLPIFHFFWHAFIFVHLFNFIYLIYFILF